MLSQIHKRNREQEMREEWQEFVESQVWQGEDEHTKNMGVGNVADFWLSKRRKELAELLEKVDGMKKRKNDLKTFGGMGYFHQQGYNQAVSDFKSLLLEKIVIIENE